jgi:hypothetical protein
MPSFILQMDFFHIVYDTCLLRDTPFGGPVFERLVESRAKLSQASHPKLSH